MTPLYTWTTPTDVACCLWTFAAISLLGDALPQCLARGLAVQRWTAQIGERPVAARVTKLAQR